MQTEDIRVAVRARRGWESIDLGFRMARVWWKPLFGAWLAVVLPVSILLHVLLLEYLWLATLLVWWLKPMFDRVALYVLSEALFGTTPTVRETLAAIPKLLRTGVLRSLLPYRLTPLRSFSLPVLQLEGARGAKRRARARLLLGRETNVALGLFLACVHFEILLWLAGFQLIWSFIPEEAGVGFFDFAFESEGLLPQALSGALYVMAMAIIEPFYVAGGFALYINRRMYLEGWDIDLVFQRLARRARASRVGAGAALGVVLACALALPPTALAQPDEEPASCANLRPEDAAACIAAVLADPEFSQTQEISYWGPKGDAEPEEIEASGWGDAVAAIGRVLAVLFESIAWIALLIAAIAIGYLVARRSMGARAPALPRHEEPAIRFGLDVRPESLPEDVVASARLLWANGDARGALSLLYRGALVHLIRVRGLTLPSSATEGECTRLAHATLDITTARDFGELTSAWQLCAYGQRDPDDARFSDLCTRWQPHLRPVPEQVPA